jgi:hypothetical protein
VLCRTFISRYLDPQDRTRSSGTFTAAYFIGLGVGYFIGPSFLNSSREVVKIHINSLNSGSFVLSIFWLALILLAYTQKYTSKSVSKQSESTTSGYVEAFLYVSYAVSFYNIIQFTHPDCLTHHLQGSSNTIYLWSGLLPLLTSPVYVILYASSFFLDDNTLLISGLILGVVALGIMVVKFATFWFIIGCILLYLATHISLSAVLAIGMKTRQAGRVALILSTLAVIFYNAGRYAGDFNHIGFRISGLTFAVGVLLWGLFLSKNLNSNLKA